MMDQPQNGRIVPRVKMTSLYNEKAIFIPVNKIFHFDSVNMVSYSLTFFFCRKEAQTPAIYLRIFHMYVIKLFLKLRHFQVIIKKV